MCLIGSLWPMSGLFQTFSVDPFPSWNLHWRSCHLELFDSHLQVRQLKITLKWKTPQKKEYGLLVACLVQVKGRQITKLAMMTSRLTISTYWSGQPGCRPNCRPADRFWALVWFCHSTWWIGCQHTWQLFGFGPDLTRQVASNSLGVITVHY